MTKNSAKEPKAVLEARAWKQRASDLIRKKGWDAFLRQSEATAARWDKLSDARVKTAR